MNNKLIRLGAFGLVAALLAGGAYTFVDRAEAETAQVAATAPAAGNAKVVKLDSVIKPAATYATVDGQALKGAELKEFVKRLPPQLQSVPADNANNLLELVVNQIVNDKLVAKQAAADKLDQDKDVQARVKEAQEQIIRDVFVEKKLEGKISDKDVKAKYDEMIASMPTELEARARHILVADEKLANEILAKLKKGEKFEDLAKAHSTDATKENGGDLGYFVKSAMVPEFGEAVFSMKKGQVSTKPTKTQFGWHIVKVEDIRPQTKPTFDQVKDRVRAQLTDEKIRKIVEDLRNTAKIEITIPKS